MDDQHSNISEIGTDHTSVKRITIITTLSLVEIPHSDLFSSVACILFCHEDWLRY